ncbi:hypothetical protein GF352_02135 [archaeon]|nr:hypothetical protein [archaeon]
MSEFVIKKVGKQPVIKDAVLVEGLPGIGNIARLSVDYLIDKLGAEKIIEIYSDVFPNSVTITDDSVIQMFNAELYHARVNNRDLLFLAGDVQPTSNDESYALCTKIIELVKGLGVKEVVTLGGIGLPENPAKTRVHAVVNDDSVRGSLKSLGLVFDGNETVKVILGVTGLLLGVAGLKGLKGFSLLAETLNQPGHVGVKEAREVLKVLTKHLGFELDFNDLDDEIKSFEQELSDEAAMSDKFSNEMISKRGYIG